jgi:hypothetical protein
VALADAVPVGVAETGPAVVGAFFCEQALSSSRAASTTDPTAAVLSRKPAKTRSFRTTAPRSDADSTPSRTPL